LIRKKKGKHRKAKLAKKGNQRAGKKIKQNKTKQTKRKSKVKIKRKGKANANTKGLYNSYNCMTCISSSSGKHAVKYPNIRVSLRKAH